jgi:hypothetical protein
LGSDSHITDKANTGIEIVQGHPNKTAG